jgi:heat shock protein HtpX
VLGPLVKLALSRRRELLADSSGVELTRNPAGLLSALRKLQGVDVPFARFNQATAAMCIVDPTQRPTSRRSWVAKLYDTHPPLEERIAALETLMIGHPDAGPELTRE